METAEIIKGNKLIAEFMGYHRRESYDDEFMNEKSWHIDSPIIGWFNDEDLQYHTSWDWLMPVIKKINDMPPKGRLVFSKDHTLSTDIGDALLDLNIEGTWQVVLKFITWRFSLLESGEAIQK